MVANTDGILPILFHLNPNELSLARKAAAELGSPKIKNKVFVRKHKQYFLDVKFNPAVDEFIEIIAEWYFYRDALHFFTKKNILDQSGIETINKTILLLDNEIVSTLDHIESNIQNAGFAPINLKREMEIVSSTGYSRACIYYKMLQEVFDPLIKTCTCGKVFLARRNDTIYCDACRKKVHVYNARARKKNSIKIPLPSRPCEYCGKKFTPKTKRIKFPARFCSDICRVHAGREKKIIS